MKSQVISALFLSLLMPGSIAIADGSPNEGTRTTLSGHVFVRDRSHAGLGEAWRDESGMVWGDVVRGRRTSIFERGEPLPSAMFYGSAKAHCENMGATLPSTADFERLRSYMGASTGSADGYSPQVLPGLSESYRSRLSRRLGLVGHYGNQFWTSDLRDRLYAGHDGLMYQFGNTFHGMDGYFIPSFAWIPALSHQAKRPSVNVRCVVQR